MTWIVTVATCVIAWYAYENHKLAREVKSASEEHQQKMNEILKSISRAIVYNANSESRNETLKEIKEQEIKERQKFVTGGK